MLPADLRGLNEAYNKVNSVQDENLISDELIEEIVEELIQECIQFGYDLDEASDAVEEAAIEYLMELNPYAPAGSKEARAYQKSTTATKRGEARKAAVSAAKEKVKAKVKGAVAGAGIAASIAKDEARRAGRKAAHAVSSTVQKKKAEVKSGVKSLIGKGLRKAAGAVGKVAKKASSAASRLGEQVEQVDEAGPILPGEAGKAPSSGYKSPVLPGEKRLTPKMQEKTPPASGRLQLAHYEMDNWDLVLEYLITNGHADTNSEAIYVMSQLDEEMIQSILEGSYEDRIAANNKKYDANRKRAAQRAAARNAARDAGKTGAVPGVGYVTPRRESETYRDSAGTERHKSGAKMP